MEYFFDYAIRYNILSIGNEINNECSNMEKDHYDALKKTILKCPERKNNILTILPNHGISYNNIMKQLIPLSSKENQDWKDGKYTGTVYAREVDNEENEEKERKQEEENNEDNKNSLYYVKNHTDLMNKVYNMYCWSNPLHFGCWPKVSQCGGEVVAMTGNLLHAPGKKKTENSNCDSDSNSGVFPYGCLTSGGTESIILAIRAHLYYYGKLRGIQYPEIICGSTAHASVDKACEMFHIRQVVIDCCSNTNNYKLDSKIVNQYITSNTIMIYASAPCYPQGTIDPIEELSNLAIKYKIGLHVDACLGGFLLPFLTNKQSDVTHCKIPKFDFQCPGVTSMSADTHKFGYASKGTSVILYRSKELRHGQYFCYAKWSGGLYATPTIAGSRPGGLFVSAWASLVSIGKQGYIQRANAIYNATNALANSIRNDIPELVVLTDHPIMICCFTTSSSNSIDDDDDNEMFSIYEVADIMSSKYGWTFNTQQNPASAHLCVTLNVVPKIEQIIQDLKQCIQDLKKKKNQESNNETETETETKTNDDDDEKKSRSTSNSMTDKKKKKKKKAGGSAGIYGTATNLPKGPVDYMLKVFTDYSLEP